MQNPTKTVCVSNSDCLITLDKTVEQYIVNLKSTEANLNIGYLVLHLVQVGFRLSQVLCS